MTKPRVFPLVFFVSCWGIPLGFTLLSDIPIIRNFAP